MEMLIDIHGQHDHQSLLYPAKHLEILDKFAKDKIEDKLADLKELNNNYKKLKQKGIKWLKKKIFMDLPKAY